MPLEEVQEHESVAMSDEDRVLGLALEQGEVSGEEPGLKWATASDDEWALE